MNFPLNKYKGFLGGLIQDSSQFSFLFFFLQYFDQSKLDFILCVMLGTLQNLFSAGGVRPSVGVSSPITQQNQPTVQTTG